MHSTDPDPISTGVDRPAPAPPPVDPEADRYKRRTERLEALASFASSFGVCPYGDGPLKDGFDILGADDDLESARKLAVLAAYRAIRRIADEP